MAAHESITNERSFDYFIEKFNNMSLESDITEEFLTSFKIIIANDKEKRLHAIEQTDFLTILDFLSKQDLDENKRNQESTKLTEDIYYIIEKLLAYTPIDKVDMILLKLDVMKISNPLLYSQTKKEKFLLFILNQWKRMSEECPDKIMKSKNYVKFLIFLLASESLQISSSAQKILQNVFLANNDLSWFFTDENISLCKEIISNFPGTKNSVIKFRFFELFVDLVLVQPSYLSTFETEEFNVLSSLLEELNGNDILAQLNALDIISRIALYPEGLHVLQDKGIFVWLELVIVNQDLARALLLPGAIRCFGNLAVLQPFEIVTRYPKILEMIVSLLSHDDPTIACLCAETVCVIASKPGALQLLYRNPDMIKHAVSQMGQMVENFNIGEHARQRTLDALVLLFDQRTDNSEIFTICEKMYGYLHQNSMKFIFDLLKQPFAEIRTGALQLLKALSKFSWVEQDMALCGGFLEYLINRQTEQDKLGHELKYDIILNLASSASAKENVGIVFYEKLCQYKSEGPFFAAAQVHVELEEAN